MKIKQLVYGGLLMAGFSFSAVNTNAQDVAVGLRLGANFNNVTWKDVDGRTIDGTKILPGLNVGVTFDIPVATDFYVQPGALFSTKGTKLTGDANEVYWNQAATSDDYTNLSAYYLEVPVNFIYKPVLGTGKLLIGAGPYFAYGLGGKWKDSYNGDKTDGKLEFFNDWNDQSADTDIQPYGKPVDVGANILFGYEFNRNFSAQLNTQLGVANLEPDDDGMKPESKFKNVGFGISIGYKF